MRGSGLTTKVTEICVLFYITDSLHPSSFEAQAYKCLRMETICITVRCAERRQGDGVVLP